MNLTTAHTQSHTLPALAKSSAGIGVSFLKGGHRHQCGFFVSTAWQAQSYERAVRGSLGSAGTLSRYANLHGSAHPDWRRGRGNSNRIKEDIAMSTTTPEIRLIDGRPVTTSRAVASFFKKQHQHVTQKIEKLDCSAQFLTSNFSLVPFNHNGNTYTEYQITKDGFVFLAMGFTGKKAATFKEAYINRFNELEKQTQHLPAAINDHEKYQMVNNLIQSMGFKSQPVLLPNNDVINLIQTLRFHQQQLRQIQTSPEWMETTIRSIQDLTNRKFLGE